jgi:hypothetical protein
VLTYLRAEGKKKKEFYICDLWNHYVYLMYCFEVQ